VPKLQAVKNLIADPQKYGLVMADVPNAPYFTVVRTTVRMDVKRAAELAELPVDEFLALNPQHNRPVISGADDYALLLPIDKAEVFAAKLNLVDQPLVSWQAHRMKPGETLPQVAMRYGMSIETLRSVNGIGPRQTVPTGYALLVPMQRPTAEAAQSLVDAVFTTVPAGRTFFHTVHRGDTLHSIAARYGVTQQDLKRWNRLAGESVRSGQRLRVTSDVSPIKTAASRHARTAKGKGFKVRGGATVVAHGKGGGGGRGNAGKAATTTAARASANTTH
jgi:membrane-bound lytic murein transglycosylase D